MRPPQVFVQVQVSVREQVLGLLHGRWRTAVRLVMVLLSADGMSASDIGDLLGYHPATVRRWLDRYAAGGLDDLADRPRSGRPPIGERGLMVRIAAVLDTPGPWTIRRLWQRLGRPSMSLHTLWRRTRQVAGWRRPRLVAKGDPQRAAILSGIRRRLARLPAGSVVIAEDEAHLDLLPHLRASWIRKGERAQVMTPGKNRRATVYGALNLASGAWFYLWTRRSAAGFITVLEMLTAAYPTAPAIAVLCDNDGIHHAIRVTRWLAGHPQLRLFYGAAYSPHDNPVERIWAAMKTETANTAVTFTQRIHQARIFFRSRTATQMLTTAAPWSSPWIPPSYAQKFYSAA
jgi:transposase